MEEKPVAFLTDMREKRDAERGCLTETVGWLCEPMVWLQKDVAVLF